jgi:dTDP-4-amino-4,6-dideoxy-D-glucose ammonia-lyase
LGSKYWTNTLLPLINSGHFASALNQQYQYPNRIGLYPGLNCQFFCSFCGRNFDAVYDRVAAQKSLDVFKKVIDEDPRDTAVWRDRFRISGGLEPLTNPAIGDLVKYGTNAGFNMQMYTNGYALTPRFLDRQSGLLDLEVMRISLYGTDAASYAAVTKNANAFDQVMSNIRHFLAQRSEVKLGVNWIVLPGRANQVLDLVELIKSINSESGNKIQFVTLREDFSQSTSYVGDQERVELIAVFETIEQQRTSCPELAGVHFDYGYQLEPVRHGEPKGPLLMADWKQMDPYGFPQIATAVDSLGNLYVYHESGFLDRPGSNRYIIGSVLNHTVEQIVQTHLHTSGIRPKPFDVGFLDAFDHIITLALHQAQGHSDWQKHLETIWR